MLFNPPVPPHCESNALAISQGFCCSVLLAWEEEAGQSVALRASDHLGIEKPNRSLTHSQPGWHIPKFAITDGANTPKKRKREIIIILTPGFKKDIAR